MGIETEGRYDSSSWRDKGELGSKKLGFMCLFTMLRHWDVTPLCMQQKYTKGRRDYRSRPFVITALFQMYLTVNIS